MCCAAGESELGDPAGSAPVTAVTEVSSSLSALREKQVEAGHQGSAAALLNPQWVPREVMQGTGCPQVGVTGMTF